jgi:hypothetical protein
MVLIDYTYVTYNRINGREYSSCLHREGHDLFGRRFDEDDIEELPYPVEPITIIKASHVSPRSRGSRSRETPLSFVALLGSKILVARIYHCACHY